MPGEPIDEFSIAINADTDGLITNTQDAMRQIESMMNDLAEKGKELGEIEPDQLVSAFDKISEVLGNTLEGAEAAEVAVRKLEAAGVSGGAAYVVFAEALEKMNIKTEEFGDAGDDADERLELQDILLEKVNKNLNVMKQAYEDAGKAIPIEKLKTLEKQLVAIFQAGVLEQRLPLDEVFKRMDEKTREALSSLQGYNREAGKTESIFGGIAQKIGGAFGIDVQKMMGQVQGLMSRAAGVASKFGIELGAITTAAVAVAGALALAGVAIVAFVKFAKEGIAIALKNSEAYQRLNLAVRQHQRALGELSPTQAEARAAASQLADDWVMAAGEAENLIAKTMFLTRQFKLSADQTFKLADSAAVLATAAGIEAESALRSITQFMLTGYTRGLQQLGITISDTAVQHRAFEMNLISLTGEVDENTRALVAAAIIEEEANKQREDAIDSLDTYAKGIEEASNRMEKAQEITGQFLLPVVEFFEKFKANVVTGFVGIFNILAVIAIKTVARVVATIQTMSDVIEEAIRRVREGDLTPGISLSEFEKTRYGENFAKQTEIAAAALKDLFEVGDDITDFGETFEDMSEKVFGAARKITVELDKLQIKFDEAMARISQRLADTMAKITVDFGRRRKDAALDLTRDMRDIDKDAQERTVEALVDQNEELFRLEEDHKLRMKRLEDQFLFDLEDAVRERDARGVLMAIRRFNQQKKEMEQDKNIRTKRLKEDFKKELQEIELERRRRRAERMLEFMEQSDDLAEQEARRREDALAAFARAERDLEAANRRKVQILAKGFLEQFKATNISLNELYDLLAAYLAPGGFVSLLYESIAAEAAALELSPTVMLSSQTSTTTSSPTRIAPGASRQRGGTFFATSPTLLQVGEIPERVDITPLSQGTGMPRAGFEGAGGGGGRTDINLEVMLEEGLEAHLVDQTMDGVANVLLNIGRKAKR